MTESTDLILRAFLVEISPTKEQRRYLERAAGIARFAYNWALARWRLEYRLHRLLVEHPERTARLLERWGSEHAAPAREAAKAHQRFVGLAARLAPSVSPEQLAERWKRRCPARTPNAYALHAKLTQLKKTAFSWMREVTAYAVREAVNDVGVAYAHFFRRLKEGAVGREAGEPRFRAKSEDCAWHIDQGNALKTRSELVRVRSKRIDKFTLPREPGSTAPKVTLTREVPRTREEWRSAIYAPGLEWIACCPGQRLPNASFDAKKKEWLGDPGVKLCAVGFSRKNGRWFAAVRAWVPRPKPRVEREPGKRIGVEVGVRELAVTSTDRRFAGMRDIERINRAIMKRNLWERRMARRHQAGKSRSQQSAGWHEARRMVARYHRLVALLRDEVLHYTSRRIVDQGAEVVLMRDMRVRDMLRRDNKRDAESVRTRNALAPMVQHVGMYELRRKVEYKQKWAGGDFVVVPHDEPITRTCHACGVVRDSEPPYGRPWHCAACGSVNDRELNAAQNLENYRTPSGAPVAGPGTRGRKTRRKAGTTAATTAKPGASPGKPDGTDGADAGAERATAPTARLGSGNGAARKAPARRAEKRVDSSTTPGSPGEPGAHQAVSKQRENSGAHGAMGHGSQPNPEGARGARADRSQSGNQDSETATGSA